MLESCKMMDMLEQYRKLLDLTAAVTKTDKSGKIIYANDQFCEISGYSREELLGQNHRIVKHPDINPAFHRELWRTITSKKIWTGMMKNRTKDGKTYYIKSIIMPILNEDGKIVEYMSSGVDITKFVERTKVIRQQSIDMLTRVKNMTSLLYELSLQKSKVTLILINIEGFSDINDFYGFDRGNNLLIEFAKELKHRFSNVYRISGDEFAILYTHEFNDKIREQVYSTINELEQKEFNMSDDTITLLLSCGVAYGATYEVYKQAHIALKNNKYTNIIATIYNETPELSKRISKNIQMVSKIKNALKEDKFKAVYQGILDNSLNKITKYESLIRMEDNGELLSPFFFLEYAKKAKMYTKLTKIMIKKAFDKFKEKNCEFSINFTFEDIKNQNVVNKLIECIKKYQCGNRVIIELVESESIEDYELVDNFIKNVREYGCKIAIDDFGTGYSNFNYLVELNVDYVKIDASLIKDIHIDNAKRTIVESIVHFSKNLGIKTIAEFVDKKEVFEIVKELGIDYSQGYLFAKPTKEIE